MFTAKEIRNNARKSLTTNYGLLLAGYIVTFLIMGVFYGSDSALSYIGKDGRYYMYSTGISILSIIIGGPMFVGFASFCLDISRRKDTQVGNIFSVGFGKCFGTAVLTNFLKGLFILLWSLLLVVPGIIKALAYSLAEYLIADNPGMGAMEAIKRSQELMKGHKARLFRLILSFIGWYLLSALTAGILMLFYVGPYYSMAMAEFYRSVVEAGKPADANNGGETVGNVYENGQN